MKLESSVWNHFNHACFRGSVFPKSLVMAVPSGIIAFLGNYYYGVRSEGDGLSSMLGSFTFILGFMLVFRTQQAYKRWWEGGTLMQKVRGDWFNAYSSVLAFTDSDSDENRHFVHRLALLMSLLYGCALEQSSTAGHEFGVLDMKGIDEAKLDFLDQSHDRCEIVLQWIQKTIVQAEREGILRVAPPILSRIYQQLSCGYANLANARKIKQLPIPFPLRQTATVLLWLHLLTNTYFCAIHSNTPAEAAIAAFVNVFAFWSVNHIAIELENPYGDDPNDLPLEAMMKDYNLSVTNLLHPSALSPPTLDNVIAAPLVDALHANQHAVRPHPAKASSSSYSTPRTSAAEVPAPALEELTPSLNGSLDAVKSLQHLCTNTINSSLHVCEPDPGLAVNDVLVERVEIKGGDEQHTNGIEPTRQEADRVALVEACVGRMKRRLSELDAREISLAVEGNQLGMQRSRRKYASSAEDHMRVIESTIVSAVVKPGPRREPDSEA